MQQSLIKQCNCIGFCQNQHLSKNAIGRCGFFCKLGRLVSKVTAYTPYSGFGRLMANVLGANNSYVDTPQIPIVNEPQGSGATHQVPRSQIFLQPE
jgi:hypothetical protein